MHAFIFALCGLTALPRMTKATTATATLTSVVRTSAGPVRGELLETVRHSRPYASFKGIPYAEAPLGYSRFKVRAYRPTRSVLM